jgi:anti-anti-sigma regulatory factor
MIRLDGHLDAAGVNDLKAEFSSVETPLRIDLSGLRLIDQAGIAALRSLQVEGAELHGGSLYIRQLLEEED